MNERYDYEARIVDERLDAERYVRSWVDGYGEVRFTLSPWGRCGMRMFGKRVHLDPVVRSAGVILATAWV